MDLCEKQEHTTSSLWRKVRPVTLAALTILPVASYFSFAYGTHEGYKKGFEAGLQNSYTENNKEISLLQEKYAQLIPFSQSELTTYLMQTLEGHYARLVPQLQEYQSRAQTILKHVESLQPPGSIDREGKLTQDSYFLQSLLKYTADIDSNIASTESSYQKMRASITNFSYYQDEQPQDTLNRHVVLIKKVTAWEMSLKHLSLLKNQIEDLDAKYAAFLERLEAK